MQVCLFFSMYRGAEAVRMMFLGRGNSVSCGREEKGWVYGRFVCSVAAASLWWADVVMGGLGFLCAAW